MQVCTLVLLVAFLGFCLAPTADSQELTLRQLAAATKTYLRDTAEFPLKMEIQMQAFDSSGRRIKNKTGKGSYDFHGYNPRSENSNGSMRVSKSMLPAAWNSMTATMMPSNILFKNAAEKYSLEVTEPAWVDHVLLARLAQSAKCLQFKWSAEHTMPEELCGASQFEVQKGDLSLQRYSFDAGGLPLATVVKPFGKCQLTRYHIEAEFQKTLLAGDPKPFLVPKHVEITVETDKGKLVMSTSYAPKR